MTAQHNDSATIYKLLLKEHIIYSIKMVLLGDVINQDLPKGVIFGKGQLGKIKKFVKFVLFSYIS